MDVLRDDIAIDNPAIALFKKHGFTDADIDALEGRELAETVAKAMIAFGRAIGAPTTLCELKGYSEATFQQIIAAAKDPDLKMKLQNMPVSMTADDVDPYMAPIIRAAESGDLSLIVNK